MLGCDGRRPNCSSLQELVVREVDLHPFSFDPQKSGAEEHDACGNTTCHFYKLESPA